MEKIYMQMLKGFDLEACNIERGWNQLIQAIPYAAWTTCDETSQMAVQGLKKYPMSQKVWSQISQVSGGSFLFYLLSHPDVTICNLEKLYEERAIPLFGMYEGRKEYRKKLRAEIVRQAVVKNRVEEPQNSWLLWLAQKNKLSFELQEAAATIIAVASKNDRELRKLVKTTNSKNCLLLVSGNKNASNTTKIEAHKKMQKSLP